MFSIFNPGKPPYNVAKIGQGKLLEYAKSADIHQFFQAWMQKRPRKALVGCHFELYQDTEYLYWGKPIFQRLFSDKRVVQEFFKTPLEDITTQFPNYKKVWGNVVRLKLQNVIAENLEIPAYVSVSSGSFRARLEGNYIYVHTPCSITYRDDTNSESSKKANYTVILDKNTLDLIQITNSDTPKN